MFPPDTRVPVAAVSRYWGQLRGVPAGQVRAELGMLADRELLVLDRDEVAFHDLQHSYLLLQADDLALLHDGLLAGYRALLARLGPGGGGCRPGSRTSGIICCITCSAPGTGPGPPAR